MTRKWVAALICLLMFVAGVAVFAQQSLEETAKHPSCKYCGMDRKKFAQSRMVIHYKDGTEVPTCSIHCAAIDLAVNQGKSIEKIEVGDYNTRALIDARSAYWVIGGKEAGVMSEFGKWAFADKKAAEEFLKSNGGTLGTFDDAMRAAFSDMYGDLKRILMKREHMHHAEGSESAMPMPMPEHSH